MDQPGYTLSEIAAEQLRKLVRLELAKFKNPEGHRARWMRGPGGCVGTYDLRVLFSPSAGTGTISVTYNNVTENFTLQYDASSDDIKTAIDSHTQLSAAGLKCQVIASTGALNNGNTLISVPQGATMRYVSSSLTRGSGSPVPEFKVWIAGSCG